MHTHRASASKHAACGALLDCHIPKIAQGLENTWHADCGRFLTKSRETVSGSAIRRVRGLVSTELYTDSVDKDPGPPRVGGASIFRRAREKPERTGA
jgi:hypothetical protein